MISASSRSQPRTVLANGLAARTYAPLDSSDPFSARFPVDVVYLWVDGSDPEWLARKTAREVGWSTSSDAVEPARFRQFDELRYSLRSLERHAPWVRKIYLVTDRQRPSWLEEAGTNLTVVDHTEILPPSALPTFNSHALSASVHRIPGLADHFVLFNDDILLGRLTRVERLFHGNGIGRFFLSRTELTTSPRFVHEEARIHTVDLIEKVMGFRPTHVFRHAPHAFNRDLLAQLEREFESEWRATVHSPFRAPTDLVPSYLHHYIGYSRGLALPAQISYTYLTVGAPDATEQRRRYLLSEGSEALCINDPAQSLASETDEGRQLTEFLETLFPVPSRYERTV